MLGKIKILGYFTYGKHRVVQLHLYLRCQLSVYQLLGCLPVKILSYYSVQIPGRYSEFAGIKRQHMLFRAGWSCAGT